VNFLTTSQRINIAKTAHPLVWLLIINVFALTPSGVFAAPSICKNDSMTEKSICNNTVESNEFVGACPKKHGLQRILSGSKSCGGRSSFPSITWKLVEEGDPIVTVDPVPGQTARSSRRLIGKGYVLQDVSIDYTLATDPPVHVACEAQKGDPFHCDISTVFADLNCDAQSAADTPLLVKVSGVYKKPDAPDQTFDNRPVTFDYNGLVKQICDAEAQLQKTRETNKIGQAPE
jgi:hypothetical protein